MSASKFPYGSVAGEAEHKEIIYLQRAAQAAQAITPSSATFKRNTFSFVDSRGNTRTININDSDVPIVTSSADSIKLDNEADNTAFDEEFGVRVRRAFVPQQIYINICAGLNISAFSSGNFLLTNVLIDMYQYSAGSKYPIVQNLNYATGHGNLAATGTQLMIIRDSPLFSQVNLSPNDIVTVRVRTTATLDTGTSQQGVVPVFPLSATATLKDWSVSSVIIKGIGVEP